MKKEIIRECTNESEYNEKLRMIKNTLAGAPCSIKEYENGTKKFYGEIEVLLEDEKLTNEQDINLIEFFEVLEELEML
jgi:hypothetical protein